MEGVNPIQCSNIDDAFLSILNHDRQIHSGKKWNLAPERNVVRCGLGTGSISIAYDGKLFGCQEQDSRDTNDYFYKIINSGDTNVLLFKESKDLCIYKLIKQIAQKNVTF